MRKHLNKLISSTAITLFGAYCSGVYAFGDGVGIPSPIDYMNAGGSASISGDYSVLTWEGEWGLDPGAALVYVNGNTRPIQKLTIPEQTVTSQTFDSNFNVTATTQCFVQSNQMELTGLGNRSDMSDNWLALSANGFGWNVAAVFGDTSQQSSGCTGSRIFFAKKNSDFLNHVSYTKPYGDLIHSVNLPHGNWVSDMTLSDDYLAVVTGGRGVHIYHLNKSVTPERWEYRTTLLKNTYVGYGTLYTKQLAIEGNRLIVGVPASGKIYAFDFNPQSNQWSETWQLSNGEAEFGKLLDFTGNHLVVSSQDSLSFYDMQAHRSSSAIRIAHFPRKKNVVQSDFDGGVLRWYDENEIQALGISTGERNGETVTRAVAYFQIDPLLHGFRKSYEFAASLDTFINQSEQSFFNPHPNGYQFGSTGQDPIWNPLSVRMSGNALVVSDTNLAVYSDKVSAENVVFATAGGMVFDRFDKMFDSGSVIDNAEGERVWVNAGDFNWFKHSGPTSSFGTGPSGAASGEYYYYVETSFNTHQVSGDPGTFVQRFANQANKTASLQSGGVPIVIGSYLYFDYHMYGSQIGTLKVKWRPSDRDDEWQDLPTPFVIDNVNENRWHSTGIISLDELVISENAGNPANPNDFQTKVSFLIEYTTKGGYEGDVGIDNITIGRFPVN